jgi:hypothetical protein
MNRYRVATSISWINRGYREFEAENLEGAVRIYERRYPGDRNGLAKLQILVGRRWRFATEVSPTFCDHIADTATPENEV